MIEIQLTKGFVAVVDDCDADLAEMKWYPMVRHPRIYAVHTKNGDNTLMHRVIMSRILNRDLNPKDLVDHERGNGLLNTRSNLRLATTTQNMQNREHSSKNPYKGITFEKRLNKWKAGITVNGQLLYLGLSSNPLDGHRAYCIAALTHFGSYANFGSSSPFVGWTLADFAASCAPVINKWGRFLLD